MTRLNRFVAAAALGMAMGPVAAAGQDLPPEIQVDLYMVRAERHMQSQEWVAALEALDVVLALQAANDLETPDALWFQHAEVAMQAGYPQTAVTSLTRYLVETGREGEYYTAAPEAAGRGGEPGRGRRSNGRTPTRRTGAGRTTARRATARRTAACRAPSRRRHRPHRIRGPVHGTVPADRHERVDHVVHQRGPVVPDASYLNGISGGGAVAFPLPFMDGMFDVQIGAHYSQKGTRVTQAGADGATATVDVAFQSLDISALARISPPQVANLPRLPFYAPCWPLRVVGIGLQRHSRRDHWGGALHLQRRVRQRESGHAARRFRALRGIGIEMGSGTTSINVGFLYSYGIQDIDKYASETARHRVLNFFAGVATGF